MGMTQASHSTEEEQTNQIEFDEFFNPPEGQDPDVSKQNFIAQNKMRQYILGKQQTNQAKTKMVKSNLLQC